MVARLQKGGATMARQQPLRMTADVSEVDMFELLCMPGLSSESIQDALWALYYIVSGGSSSEGPDEDRRRIQAVLLDNGMPFDFASWMVDLVSRFAGPNVSSSCTSNMTRSSACMVLPRGTQGLGHLDAGHFPVQL